MPSFLNYYYKSKIIINTDQIKYVCVCAMSFCLVPKDSKKVCNDPCLFAVSTLINLVTFSLLERENIDLLVF